MAAWFWRLGFQALWDPDILVGTAVTAVAFTALVLVRREGEGRAWPVRLALGWTAFAALYAAVGSPLDALGDDYLFSAHMVQHMLLTMVSVPLALAATPAWALRALIAWRPLAVVVRAVTRPWTALVLFNAVFSFWHFPALFDAALRSEGIHFLEHATLVAAAVCMWWPLVCPLPEERLHPAGQMAYVLADGTLMLGVFAFVTLGRLPLYTPYAHAPRAVPSLGPAVDQELGGIVMNLFTMVVYGALFAAAFVRWVRLEPAVDPEVAGRAVMRRGGGRGTG